MARPPAGHLKIYRDGPAPPDAEGPVDPLAELEALCQSLSAATGWTFRFVPGTLPSNDPILHWSAPVDPGVGAAPGHLRMDRDSAGGAGGMSRRIGAEEAQRLAGEMIRLYGERTRLRRSLREREAELAAGVPVKRHPRGADHLAERLTAVLRGGAEGLGCQAAAMYLLDDATTELKLRAQWGLPESRLLDAARPLRGALGDIEALAGHVVVLEDDTLFELWRVPERFAAAVCVPISSPSMVLGTLWLYCTAPRDFSPRETNVAEILAGRLAAELDREILLSQAMADRPRVAMTADVAPFAPTPNIAPLVRGWDVAVRILAADDAPSAEPSGLCVDWLQAADGSLRAIIGNAGPGVVGATVAAGLRGAWRCGAEHGDDPAALLNAVGRFLWTASAGDVRASAAALQLRPNGEVRLSTAGPCSSLVVRKDGPITFAGAVDLAAGELDAAACLAATTPHDAGPPLGRDPDAQHAMTVGCVAAGETIVFAADAVRLLVDQGRGPLDAPSAVLLFDACRAMMCHEGPGAIPSGTRPLSGIMSRSTTAVEFGRRLEECWRHLAAESDSPAPRAAVAVLVARRRDLTGAPLGS